MAVKVSDMTVAILSLSVTVILITMVLAPVISDVISDSSSGYTNTGEYYYKTAKEGENHTITVEIGETETIIKLDGETIHSITMGLDVWYIPMVTFTASEGEDITHEDMALLEYLVGSELDLPLENDKTVDIVSNFGPNLWGSSNLITININGTEATFIEEGEETQTAEIGLYMAKTGPWVLCENAVITPDQSFYALGGDGGLTDLGNNVTQMRYLAYTGYGTIETITDSLECPSLDWQDYNGSGWTGYTPTYNNEIGPLETTDKGDYIQLDNIPLTEHFKLNDSDVDYAWTINIDSFIVPVEVGEGSGDSGISPTLKSMISIIPLIVTVGIVLSAITMIRMKN